MKANKDKCHLLVSDSHKNINVCGAETNSSNLENLLTVKIDSILNFEEHISNILTKANRKINALLRVTPYMGLSMKIILMNSFFTSQFSYSSLVWMFHSRTIHKKKTVCA